MTPPAHADHWLTGLLYPAPVAIVVLAWQGHRERDNNAEHREGD